MAKKKPCALYLVPPPGPLCWLHPDLRELSVSLKNDGILDMNREGLIGNDLLDALRQRAPSFIEVQPGPRGHTLALWLSQALRKVGIQVKIPSPEAQGIPELLESLLEEGTDAMHQDDTFLFSRQGGGSPWKRKTVPFSEKTARNILKEGKGSNLWLLPIRSSTDLRGTVTSVKKDAALFRDAGLIPYFVTDPAPESGSKGETRLSPSWWGILPGDRYPASVRNPFRELFRLLRPERTYQFLMWEHYALTGIDCFLEGLMDRFNPVRLPEKKRKGSPLILGVCGTDGSGKSSHVDALEQWLQEQGLSVSRHKIYRHGVFHDTVTDLTRQCKGDKNLHLWRLQRLIKVFDSIKYYYRAVEEDLDAFDVILFDRFTFTHLAAGAGRYHCDPFARELLSVFPRPDRIYLLDVPTEEALRRIGKREEKTVDENPYMLSRYRHALLDLGERHDFLVLDALKPFEENRRIILEDARELVASRGLGGIQ